jgi:alpha-amylase
MVLMASYDIWDLGEFDQKGSVGTKWGTKEDLVRAIKTAKEKGIISYIDAVMNHKYVQSYGLFVGWHKS